MGVPLPKHGHRIHDRGISEIKKPNNNISVLCVGPLKSRFAHKTEYGPKQKVMEIRHEERSPKGLFEAFLDGKPAGRMTYTWAGDDKIIIDHTEADPAFSGRGVGKSLVLAAVDYARRKNIKILPLCPFAKSVFERTKDIQDTHV